MRHDKEIPGCDECLYVKGFTGLITLDCGHEHLKGLVVTITHEGTDRKFGRVIRCTGFKSRRQLPVPTQK